MEERPGAPSRMIVVGWVARPVGLRGEVVVEPSGDDPERFSEGSLLYSQSDPRRALRIRRSRSYGKRYAVLFEGAETRETAESLRGMTLCVPEEDLPRLPPGVYYHYQVLGLVVVDVDGAVLGPIESILDTGSNEVYCVGEGADQILIPAVRDFVGRIDLTSGRLFLNVPRSALGMEEDPI